MTTTTAPTHISKSQIKRLLRCGEDYRVYYVEGFKLGMPSRVWGGIWLHNIIAKILTEKQLGGAFPEEDQITGMIAGLMAEKPDPPIRWLEPPNDRVGIRADLARAVLAFKDELYPQIKPLLVETKWEFDLNLGDGMRHPVEGYLDVVEDDEHKTIRDFKFTQRWAPTLRPGIEPLMYSVFHNQRFPEVKDTRFITTGFCRYKANGKKKLPERVEIREAVYTVSEAERMFFLTKTLAPALRRKIAGIYEADLDKCSSCDYADHCRGSLL